MRITVCTIAVNDWYQEIVKYNLRNMKTYCDIHKYTFVTDLGGEGSVYDKTRDAPWYKIKLIKKLLLDCDYCVWIDADSHILNMKIRLESFIEKYMKEAHILLGKEMNTVLNTGVMFVKNSEFSLNLLDLIWDNSSPFDSNFHEQASLSDLYSRNVSVKEFSKDLESQFEEKVVSIVSKVVILPTHMQNEFLTYWFTYYPGDCFIFHAARCAHDREGFIFTMDLFCPIRLDEESDEQYKARMLWLNTKENCRKTIDGWLKGEYIQRIPSARNSPGFT